VRRLLFQLSLTLSINYGELRYTSLPLRHAVPTLKKNCVAELRVIHREGKSSAILHMLKMSQLYDGMMQVTEKVTTSPLNFKPIEGFFFDFVEFHYNTGKKDNLARFYTHLMKE